jgi:hypothetical protein
VRVVAGALRLSVVSIAALSAQSAVAAERVTYRADVSVSGQITVTFHGDPAAGCEATFRCDVKDGSIRWTPQARGRLSLDGAPGRRLTGFLDLFGGEARPDTIAAVQRSAADGTHVCVDARGRSPFVIPLLAIGRRGLRFGLRPRPGVFGPVISGPLATSCGGPLPADTIQGLPTRTVSLRALRTESTTIDLSGSAAFAAGGLAGRVESTMRIRLGKALVRRVQGRARRPPSQPSSRPPVRNIAVEYRVARVAGSLPVDVAADPRSCAPLDACGLDGTLTVTPGPGHGEAYLFGYGRLSTDELRRAVGLAGGPIPREAAVFGYLSWSRARGTVTAALNRDGTPACRDTAPFTAGLIDLRVRGRRVMARLADGTDGFDGEDILRTRCPGPLLADFGGGTRLAVGRIPLRAFGRRKLTLRLNRGVSAVTPGYMLRSRPDLRIVLEREEVRVGRLEGAALVDEDGGGGGGSGSAVRG